MTGIRTSEHRSIGIIIFAGRREAKIGRLEEKVGRMEKEKAEMMVKIEQGDGFNAAVQQLQQDNVSGSIQVSGLSV
jgi:hypothetical protein